MRLEIERLFDITCTSLSDYSSLNDISPFIRADGDDYECYLNTGPACTLRSRQIYATLIGLSGLMSDLGFTATHTEVRFSAVVVK